MLPEQKHVFDTYFEQALDSFPSESRIAQAVRYTCRGGKRLRPGLLLAAADALGGDARAALPAATGIEMVHAASLVVDDMPEFDDAERRRNVPAVHVVFGSGIALLASFQLVCHAYVEVAKSGRLCGVSGGEMQELVRLLSSAIGLQGMIGGKEREGASETAVPGQYETIVKMKTASLFRLGAEAASVLFSLPRTSSDRLSSIAVSLGTAHQIADDMRDAEQDGDRGLSRWLGSMPRQDLSSWVSRLVNQARTAARSLGGRSNSLERFVLVFAESLGLPSLSTPPS